MAKLAGWQWVKDNFLSQAFADQNYAPVTHASRHATGGIDPITPADIGAMDIADLTGIDARLDALESVEAPSGVDIKVGGYEPASGWWLNSGAPEYDPIAPSVPTGLVATATGATTVVLSWTAATDNIAVSGYEYRIGTGAVVSAGAGTSTTVSGLTALTSYTFQVRSIDAAGNRSGWSTSASATTLAGPDTIAPTPGTLAASAITATTFTLTVTGASDAVALHATPYAFSTDNGTTWSAWQAGATYNVTGKSGATGYQARHKVRDVAGNEATGAAITVTTLPPPPIVTDDFNRSGSLAGTTTTTGNKVWSGGSWTTDGSKASGGAGSGKPLLADITAQANQRVDFKVGFHLAGNTGLFGGLEFCSDGAKFYKIDARSLVGSSSVVRMQAHNYTPAGANGDYVIGRVLAAGEMIPITVTARSEGAATRVIVTVEGVEAFNILDTNAGRPAAKGVALWAQNGVYIDDLVVYEL